MNLFKILVVISQGLNTNAQVLVGSQRDDHNCVLDGGYSWCETTKSCVRLWKTPCPSISIEHGPGINCNNSCPPPFPCAIPYLPNINMDNCKLNSYTDDCGCQTRCPSYDCTNNNNCRSDTDCLETQFCRVTSEYPLSGGRRGLQQSECVDKLDVGSTCGGYTPPEYQTRCLDHLECAYTMEPMVADAPGECRAPCSEGVNRNDRGDCVSSNVSPTIPGNCVTWNDGCNTCQVVNGQAKICTRMYCFTQNTPYCMHFSTDPLRVGEICYRSCEDGSQESIDRRDMCPGNSQCISKINKNMASMISYDSCNNRAMTCEYIAH